MLGIQDQLMRSTGQILESKRSRHIERNSVEMNMSAKVSILTFIIVQILIIISVPNARSDEQELPREFIAVLMSTNASIRAKEGAIRAIDIYSNQKERALLVHTALYDSNYIVREKALLRLKEVTLCQKEQQDILFDTARKAIFDNNGIVRATACGILRYNATDTNAFTIVEALCREFKIDRDARGAKTDMRLSKRKTWWRDSVVRSCIESLVFIGNLNPSAVELSYRKCPKGDVEYALLSVLAQLGRTADVEKMCRGISETSSEFVKLRLIRSLGETGDERAIPVLKDCAFDSFQIQTKDLMIVYPIREAALKSLDAIKCKLNGQ